MKKKHLLVYTFLSLLFLSCNEADSDYKNIIEEKSKENRASITKSYPSSGDISSDYVISVAMSALWKQTKSRAAAGERVEMGMMFFCEPVPYPQVMYDISSSETEIYILQSATDPGRLVMSTTNPYYCGYFHTHPPMSNLPSNYSRDVGPSDTDREYATKIGIPGLVIDYTERVVGGHDLHMPAKIYYFGPVRRRYIN